MIPPEQKPYSPGKWSGPELSALEKTLVPASTPPTVHLFFEACFLPPKRLPNRPKPEFVSYLSPADSLPISPREHMSPSALPSAKSKLATGAIRRVCVLCIFVGIFSAELGAQTPQKVKGLNGGTSEDVRTQAKRLETLAKQNFGASVEILRELLKFPGGGEAAFKAAAAKTKAAQERIEGDSTSFSVELKRAKEQLESGREELKKIEGASDIISAYIVEKIEPLAENLRQSEGVSRTSKAVLESTQKKIESWGKKYRNQEEANGRDEAVANIKILIEKEIAELTKK